jgi:hypothetical protein
LEDAGAGTPLKRRQRVELEDAAGELAWHGYVAPAPVPDFRAFDRALAATLGAPSPPPPPAPPRPQFSFDFREYMAGAGSGAKAAAAPPPPPPPARPVLDFGSPSARERMRQLFADHVADDVAAPTVPLPPPPKKRDAASQRPLQVPQPAKKPAGAFGAASGIARAAEDDMVAAMRHMTVGAAGQAERARRAREEARQAAAAAAAAAAHVEVATQYASRLPAPGAQAFLQRRREREQAAAFPQ